MTKTRVYQDWDKIKTLRGWDQIKTSMHKDQNQTSASPTPHTYLQYNVNMQTISNFHIEKDPHSYKNTHIQYKQILKAKITLTIIQLLFLVAFKAGSFTSNYSNHANKIR